MPQTAEHVLLARQVGVPALVVLHEQGRPRRRRRNCWTWSRWKSASLLTKYDFPGDDVPIIRGAAFRR
jgi:elongation factor Tu